MLSTIASAWLRGIISKGVPEGTICAPQPSSSSFLFNRNTSFYNFTIKFYNVIVMMLRS